MKTVALVLGIVVLVVLEVLLTGFAFSVLWGWFVVPLGVAALGVAHAIGLGMVVRFLTHQDTASNEGDFSTKITAAFLRPILALVFGYIVLQFM